MWLMRERGEAQAVGRGLHGKEDAGRRGGRVGEFDTEIWSNSFQSNRSSGCKRNRSLIKISAFALVPRSSLEVCLTWMSITHTHREESGRVCNQMVNTHRISQKLSPFLKISSGLQAWTQFKKGPPRHCNIRHVRNEFKLTITKTRPR